jgi:hypothetical protein
MARTAEAKGTKYINLIRLSIDSALLNPVILEAFILSNIKPYKILAQDSQCHNLLSIRAE